MCIHANVNKSCIILCYTNVAANPLFYKKLLNNETLCILLKDPALWLTFLSEYS